MALIVHHLQVSQSERIVWLCEELGIPYELKLHQRDPIYSPQSIKDLNPMGQAPVIQDGSVTLAESGACAEYILVKHGSGRLALPPSHKNYADYLYWFHFSNSNLTPAIGRVMGFRWIEADMESGFAKRSQEQLNKILELIDSRLKSNTYLAGEEFTAADCMTVFSLTTFRTFIAFELTPYKNILRYLKTCTERPGFKSYRAKGDPDLPLMINGPAPEQFVAQLKAAGKL